MLKIGVHLFSATQNIQDSQLPVDLVAPSSKLEIRPEAQIGLGEPSSVGFFGAAARSADALRLPEPPSLPFVDSRAVLRTVAESLGGFEQGAVGRLGQLLSGLSRFQDRIGHFTA